MNIDQKSKDIGINEFKYGFCRGAGTWSSKIVFSCKRTENSKMVLFFPFRHAVEK